jgi:hypothetical protein
MAGKNYIDDEEKFDETTPEAVAKRLREKIRFNAESLLSRCEESSSRHVSRQTSHDSSCASRPSSCSDVLSHPQEKINANHGSSTATLHSPSPSPGTSTAAVVTPGITEDNATNVSRSRSSPSSCVSTIDLTKRIQRLALERLSKVGLEDDKNRLRIIQSDTSSHLSSIKTFDELHLPQYLLDAIYTMGFNRPSAIQEAALPRIIAGRNLIGQAQSGSGKVRYRLDPN